MCMKNAVIALVLIAGVIPAAGAAVFEVPDGEYFTLRDAIREAEANGEPDAILLADFGRYAPGGPIALDTIDTEVRIYGRGATIDGSSAEDGRLFEIGPNGSVTIADLNIVGMSQSVAQAFVSGGVINNKGNLLLRNVSITGSRMTVQNGNLLGGVIANDGGMRAANVTISDNEVTGDATGAAIHNTGDLLLENVTVTDNRVQNGGSGSSTQALVQGTGGQALVGSSIIAGNPGGACNQATVSSGGNIDDDGTCGFDDSSDQPDTDPGLGPLADHGGGLLTHSLSSGSAALNAGNIINCTPMDARGVPRPASGVQGSGNSCDSGAYERNTRIAGFDDSVTGSWFDPNQNGHGFMLELLPGNLMLATWFVFDPQGNRDWVQALGTYRDGIARLTAYQVVDGAFPPEFNADLTTLRYWGTLSIVMHGCNGGTAAWMPDVGEYQWGGMPLTRLTTVAGLPCD